MRYAKIPEPIQLVDLVSGNPEQILDPSNPRQENGTPNFIDRLPMTFAEFVMGTSLADPKFGRGYKQLISATKIHDAVRQANGVINLEDADWELLRDVVENPSSPYHPTRAMQLVPFMRAIVEASGEKL
jgi:hypothetical protein